MPKRLKKGTKNVLNIKNMQKGDYEYMAKGIIYVMITVATDLIKISCFFLTFQNKRGII